MPENEKRHSLPMRILRFLMPTAAHMQDLMDADIAAEKARKAHNTAYAQARFISPAMPKPRTRRCPAA